jgi:hypothetical protein
MSRLKTHFNFGKTIIEVLNGKIQYYCKRNRKFRVSSFGNVIENLEMVRYLKWFEFEMN